MQRCQFDGQYCRKAADTENCLHTKVPLKEKQNIIDNVLPS